MKTPKNRDYSQFYQLRTLKELLALPQADLLKSEIATMNLLCAQGLPGAENIDAKDCLTKLDDLATRVRSETERNFHRYAENPAQFQYSTNYFRMVLMAVVLTEDFHVHYAKDKIGPSTAARMGDGFFADAHDVFLHGLTGSNHAGTCSSLPVLQVAVGRRLGYPLKLVTTRGHLFVRWEDASERFNVEAAGIGVNRFSDDYYRHWPYETSEAEEHAEGYLKSLTPAQELAVFMSIRGMCWQEAGNFAEAADAFEVASRLAPGVRAYSVMAKTTKLRQAQNRSSAAKN